jgi:hypothetical protein
MSVFRLLRRSPIEMFDMETTRFASINELGNLISAATCNGTLQELKLSLVKFEPVGPQTSTTARDDKALSPSALRRLDLTHMENPYCGFFLDWLMCSSRELSLFP